MNDTEEKVHVIYQSTDVERLQSLLNQGWRVKHPIGVSTSTTRDGYIAPFAIVVLERPKPTEARTKKGVTSPVRVDAKGRVHAGEPPAPEFLLRQLYLEIESFLSSGDRDRLQKALEDSRWESSHLFGSGP